MARITDARSVLAVRNLELSTRYYIDVLGFVRDPIEAAGWSFLSKDRFKVMLGECPDATAAGDTGEHSYFMHLLVDGVDEYYEQIKSRGALILFPPADKPWGLREFGLRTPDGHRMVFAEPVGA